MDPDRKMTLFYVAIGLVIAAGLATALILADTPPTGTPSAGGNDHGDMTGDERCRHMPEHCAGNATGGANTP